ncbi:MAG: hypothetical protein WC338_08030 [Candidatus Ratteibacteria bacterium]|jgi:hypothetical protein
MKTRAGYDAHVLWEKSRGDENECDAECKISEQTEHTSDWWNAWLDRSDEWRDELEFKQDVNDIEKEVAAIDKPTKGWVKLPKNFGEEPDFETMLNNITKRSNKQKGK